ncbi:MAG: M28 family peptidase [Sphingobacteriales bacterium]|nr:M28 family peptidase [Sphingobacteriales bacterium]MBI3719979.1 M28 family peptidase [Sphingobacteriales bacterium]
MKITCTLLALLLAFSSNAQNETAKKFAETITAGDLKKHLYIIADPEMEGRETGTEGQRKAAAYIENHFKSLGLKSPASLNGYQQSFNMYVDSMVSSSVTLNKKQLEWGKDYLVAANANENGTMVGNEVVFVGYGITSKNYDDYAGLNVKGKIVAFVNGEPKKNDSVYIVSGNKQYSAEWTKTITKKLINAYSHGAKGALFINQQIQKFSAYTAEESKISRLYLPPAEKTINGINISHAIAKSIFGIETFAAIIEKAVNLEPFSKKDYTAKKIKLEANYTEQKTTSTSTNVLGVLEGADKKDEYVFVTAHYDHLGISSTGEIYPGADDDGSGTTGLLEIAEAFAKAANAGYRPKRTIVFMTVSGEEKGLWGSEYYSNHPVFPLAKTSVDLNIDMIGRIDDTRKYGDSTNYIYVIGDDKLSSDLAPMCDSINNTYSHMELDRKFNDPNDTHRFYYRSDHYNFAAKGVPVIFFFNGTHRDYHKPTDTPDKINYELQEKRARFIFYMAWEAANRKKTMKRDIPLN